MAKGKKKLWLVFGLLVFIAYIFIAPRSIPEETALKPLWISSLESNNQIILENLSLQRPGELIPFTLGDRFGYVGHDGSFAINQIRSGYISISENYWAEYELLPASIQIMNPMNRPVYPIEEPNGYPLFLDRRTYIVGRGQHSISALGPSGETLWTHDFPATITCVDAANGYLLAGTLDGVVALLNPRGVPVFPPFEPGGSRLSVILGCAISRDASRLALISGIDNQRFLLLERSGDTYRVVYHEFIGTGFRRPVHISFVNNDTKVLFEREEGLGIFAINSRESTTVSLSGNISGFDNSGDGRYLFVITTQSPTEKRLVTIMSPGIVISEAPFRSENAFLARRGNMLFIGGDKTMAAFGLEKK
jgi:hypothetical protein